MSNPFFDHPILNSPYERPTRYWELDENGQPTQKILEARRRAEFITPIPKPKKRKKTAQQEVMVFDEGKGLSTKEQQYDPTSIINEVRQHVDVWRTLPQSSQWQVSPETARLLQHWRHHKFSGVRPFFCQVEAVETAIWLTEVAPQSRNGKRLLDHLAGANKDANPELMRFALKLATGAGKTTVMAMLHLAKGLEFRAVAVMACDDEIIPLQERIETVGDDADLQEVYDTERHLLYVACTRARDHLLVTSVEPASEFLDDLRM
jgi:type III restriction enzyme